MPGLWLYYTQLAEHITAALRQEFDFHFYYPFIIAADNTAKNAVVL